ncbi:hypothetical protein RB195_025595 [Necator americanus]|uniref:Uncharacterized protein n=1 Tax=Necator americanus TaxID=51031 RepID=A0ABR1ET06_NECAM
MIEIWQRQWKPMQLAFLEVEAEPSPNAIRAIEVQGKFVRLIYDMKQQTIAVVRTPVGYKTSFIVLCGVRQGRRQHPSCSSSLRRTVDQCFANVALELLVCLFTILENSYDIVTLPECTMELLYIVNLAWKLTAAFGFFVMTSESGGGSPRGLQSEFLSCILKNNCSYKSDIQQRWAEAFFAFIYLTKC